MMNKISVNDSLEHVYILSEMSLSELDENQIDDFRELVKTVADSLGDCSSREVMFAVVSNIFTHYTATCLHDEMLGPRMQKLRQELKNESKETGEK